MNPRIILLPLMLMFHQHAFGDSVLSSQGGLINLTAGDVSIDSRVSFDVQGQMNYNDANMPWSGVGPDGVRRKISTVAYSFEGNLTGKIAPPTTYCQKQHVWIGWTTLKRETGGVISPDSGTLYGNNLAPSAAVQTQYEVNGLPSDYEYIFRHQGTVGYIFVTDGPAGMYSSNSIPQVNTGSAYVYHSGDTPLVRTYLDTYGCDLWISGVGTLEIYSPPVVNPDPDTSCNFELSYDVLDLGNVNQQTAQSATASVDIIGQCDGDSSVQLKSTPSEMEMGGLTVNLRFDNGLSEKKDWQLRTDIVARTPFTASVSKVGTLVTGSYEKSGVINIIYD